jgi:F0F1-type ATP synthase assembly protein I
MQWAGLGIGDRMSGSQMFIIYQDGKGNVTLSPRPGTGNVMPQYSKMDGLELLEGSGVKDNEMIANVRCNDCKNVDLKGSDLWIAAWLSGDSLDSTSPSERIGQHDEHATFDVNLAKASISSDSNPFLSANTNQGSSSSGGAASETSSSSSSDKVQLAHGIIMSIVFIAGYPLGAILMPLLGKWIIHAGWQVVMLLLMWAGFGLGYVCARDGGYVSLPLRCTRTRTRCYPSVSTNNRVTPVGKASSHPNGHCSLCLDHPPAYPWLHASPILPQSWQARYHQPHSHLVR